MTTAIADVGRWDARDVGVAEREEAVRDALSGTHLPWDVRVPDPAGQELGVSWRTLGDTTLVACRSGPLSGRRRAPELAGTDRDHVGVLVVQEGRERVAQQDRVVELGAGDVLAWHSAAPIEFEVVEPLRKVTLLLPADRFTARLPSGRLRPVHVPGSSAIGRLIAGHVATLAQVVDGLAGAEALLAVDLALDLLARGAEPLAPPVGSALGDLAARALAVVEADLDDPDLTPGSIAARLGVTTRYLHMAVATAGTTLAAHVRGRRVARVARDLADPRMDGWTVTALAHRWGFSDSAALSRAFRAVHGTTPSAYRSRERARRGGGVP